MTCAIPLLTFVLMRVHRPLTFDFARNGGGIAIE